MNEYIITYRVDVQVKAYGRDAVAAEETVDPDKIFEAMEYTRKNNKGKLVYPNCEIIDEPVSIEYQGPVENPAWEDR